MYNILLLLSRNISFYKKVKLPDNFETRIYLMFVHFSIMMIIFKKKKKKFDQKLYDQLFYKIENNLRELGFGDVAVNAKMKELNKNLYDILLKIEISKSIDNEFKISDKLIFRYFSSLKNTKSNEYQDFVSYFVKFYHFCFELPLDNMVREAINYR